MAPAMLFCPTAIAGIEPALAFAPTAVAASPLALALMPSAVVPGLRAASWPFGVSAAVGQ